MTYFDKAILEVLEHEGLLSDDKADRGGLTKYGISQKAYPNLDIAALTLDEAIAIYRRDYWRPYYDKFNDYRLACKVFDMAVNTGHKPAHKTLQRAVEVVDDGVIGQQTIAAVNSQKPEITLQAFAREQKAYYDRIIVCKPEQVKFERGWHNRAAWVPEQWNA